MPTKPKYVKRRRAYRKYKKAKTRRGKVTYPDRHNYKFEAGATVIYNSASGTVSGKGAVAIGNFSGQRTNFQQFGGVFNFNLNQTIQATQFIYANYDRYKINAIKIRVIPENNISQVSGQGTLPTMKVCYDYDDAKIPSVGDIEVRRGKTHLLNKPFNIYLKPKVANLVYRSPSSQAVSAMKAPWLNLGTPDVPHFGIKFMVRDWYCTSAPNDLQVRFVITYMFSVKEQLSIDRGPSLVEDTAPETADNEHPLNQEEPAYVPPA